MFDQLQGLAPQAYDALVAGRIDEARECLAEPGQPLPTLVWSPSLDSLSRPSHVKTLASWLDLPKHPNTDIPHYRSFDIVEFWDAVGQCVYLDVVDEGKDFRYRVYGSFLAQAVGYDMTGRLLSEFPFTRRDAVVFYAAYQAVCVRSEPIYTEHNPRLKFENGTWSRLTLPFAGDDGKVARLLTANLYAAGRMPNDNVVSVYGDGGLEQGALKVHDASSR